MSIQQMFKNDINRNINGVVQVDQDSEQILVQELNEYVITKELKKHFIQFFNAYNKSFDEINTDTGVWISGFFGSGKSHFLKMLSYILANKEVQGVKTVERFREKFADDPATFMLFDKATSVDTDTILFNIDKEGSIEKDKTVVLRVFAKMFYNYLGFYGENLKVAKLEQQLAKEGKTEEFHRVFEEKNGTNWLETRSDYAFFEDEVVETLMEVRGMSEASARNWFNGEEMVETSIAQLVTEIKDYVNSKGKDFRLLFMIDEVGQYVGDSTDLLLNLQTLVEAIGDECKGKVWIVCTGQEAIDEIIRTQVDAFSKIQARFKTRLSLSSSSVDEVIQERVLKKEASVVPMLEDVYNKNNAVLKNIFTFTDSVLDIKGYSNSTDFARNFPFVPYQFIVLQKVFLEVRKHGNSGKHMSGAERSMLSGFQEAAQKIQGKDANALAPFYLFYDTVHSFLDSSIRNVIERCQRAADNGDGLEQEDVNVLKLLYLIRYIDDIKSSVDNIVILMADDIRIDKITMRNAISKSLERLVKQGYVGRTADIYNFLTDEEQDVEREVRNTVVDVADITGKISSIIFNDIYVSKKFRYDKYDFPFDKMVDNTYEGTATGSMCLKVLTVASGIDTANELYLLTDSKDQAIVVLGDTPYFEGLERAMKIRKYIKTRNVAQMPKSMQNIIRGLNDEASKLETASKEELEKAIVTGKYYVDGEKLTITAGDVKTKINKVLEQLVGQVYKDLQLVTKNADTDEDVKKVLRGDIQVDVFGKQENCEAAAKIAEYLQMQDNKRIAVSMADIQSRYQAKPYGWKEIDIAAVVAMLIFQQKVTLKYMGETVQPNNPRLPELLRKRTEVGKVQISIRKSVSAGKIKEATQILREYFNLMNVASDEDGLIRQIIDLFISKKEHYDSLLARYSNHKYPDKLLIVRAGKLMDEVLSQRKDNIALINCIIDKEEDFDDLSEALDKVESFFKNQVNVFDAAVAFEKEMDKDLDYIEKDAQAKTALDTLRKYIIVPDQIGKFNYNNIPEFNTLMDKVKAVHTLMLECKRAELLNTVDEFVANIAEVANGNEAIVKGILEESNYFFERKKKEIEREQVISMLDGKTISLVEKHTNTCEAIKLAIEEAHKPKEPVKPAEVVPNAPKKVTKKVNKFMVFGNAKLETEEDIEKYLNDIRSKIKTLKQSCDILELK